MDGDGQYEYVVMWEPSNAKDVSQAGYTGPVHARPPPARPRTRPRPGSG
ncbi:rhamnogalacturonan lyase family protein [Crossiella sp. NPDC003009]